MSDQEKTKIQKPASDAPMKPGKLPANELSDEEMGKVSGGAGPEEEEQLQG